MNKILIIKTGHTVQPLLERSVDFEDWIIEGTGLDSGQFLVISVFQGEQLPPLESVSGIIVTGSPEYVTDRANWSEITGNYLKRGVEAELPILAICYGHQLLAHCLGGQVGFHLGGREIGTVAIDLSAEGKKDTLLGQLPDTFLAQVSHQQSVIALPADAVNLAANSFEPHHAFRIGECAWGLQFHPEFSAETIRTYIQVRQQALEKEGIEPEQLLKQVSATPESASVLRGFAEFVFSNISGQQELHPEMS